ncbi:ABC transporter ATP-binding protein [bacterium]|nr:ABC transporter ATP-binding protein [bacterium]
MKNDTFSTADIGSILLLEKVTKTFHRGSEIIQAVHDVSLSINSGDYIAVVGHSGSGKTTLMNIMGCVDRPTQGKVIIGNREIQDCSDAILTGIRRKTIGFVFQQFYLIPTLTALQNVQLPSMFAGNDESSRARELLEMVGLSDRMDHLPDQLSGGEMQRVAIARSLINSPQILLADEPTGNLDSKNAGGIMNFFETLNQHGLTIVMVTHNPDIVTGASRQVHIEDGRITQ